jgi:hypothetical protein
MRGGGDRPIAKEVAAMALPLASNDEKLRIKGLGCRLGFLPVHLLEELFEGLVLLLRRQAAELGAILPLVAFIPGIQDVDRVTNRRLLHN